MLKRRKVKAIYITEAICDKCGGELLPTGVCLTTYPAKYPYQCINPKCDGHEIFWEYELPGKLEYEFEEEENV